MCHEFVLVETEFGLETVKKRKCGPLTDNFKVFCLETGKRGKFGPLFRTCRERVRIRNREKGGGERMWAADS